MRASRLLPLLLIGVTLGVARPALALPHVVRTLPNKMTLIVRENRSRPIVTIQAWVQSGARDEAKRERGISEVVARMFFLASEKRDYGDFEKDLGVIGGSWSVDAGYSYTTVQVTVPARYADRGVEILSDALLHPRLDGTSLQKALAHARENSRSVLVAAERASISPARELLHEGSPLEAPIAVPELEIAAITVPLVERLYRLRFVAPNTAIVVVGDVDPSEIEAAIVAAFRDYPAKRAPQRKGFREKQLRGMMVRGLPNPGDTQGAALTVAFRAPEWGTADALALDVVFALLVDSPGARFRHRLSGESPEFTLAAAQRGFEMEGGTVTLSVRADPARIVDAEQAVLSEIDRVRSLPVTSEEFEEAVRSVLERDAYTRSDLNGIARATAIAWLQGAPGADEVYFDRLRAIRREDLTAVAREYLDLDRAAIVEMMPAALADSLGIWNGMDGRIREKRALIEAASHGGPPPAASTASARKARIDAPLKAILENPLDAGRGLVDRTALPSGLRVLTGVDPSAPLVTVAVYLNGGVRYEKESNNGVTALVKDLLLNTNDPASPGDTYRQSLGAKGRLVDYQDKDMWGVSVSVPADRWREVVDALGTMFAHPDMDSISIDATRIYVLTTLSRWLRDESVQRSRLIFSAKYEESGYRLPQLGTRVNLITIPAAEIERWYRMFVVKQNIVVAVFGDVAEAEVAPAVEKAFHDVSSASYEHDPISLDGPFEGFREKWELGGGPDATVTLAFNGPRATSPDVPVLYVIQGLFSNPRTGWFEQHLNSSGYISGATSTVAHSVDECLLLGSVSLAGYLREEEAVKLLLRQFKKVALLPVRGEIQNEFEDAQSYALGSYFMLLNTNTARAFQWARAEVLLLPPDYPATLPARLEAVTADDLLRVAQTYFQKDGFTRMPYAIAETRPGGW